MVFPSNTSIIINLSTYYLVKMVERDRYNNGTFASKSSQIREVRSVRLTNRTWKVLGDVAESKNITRADLIEEWVDSGAIDQSNCNEVEKLKAEIAELAAEKADLVGQLFISQAGLERDEILLLRDKALDSLGMGQQSKPYRGLSKVFSKFIETYFST